MTYPSATAGQPIVILHMFFKQLLVSKQLCAGSAEPFRPTGGEDILGQQRAKQPAARSDSVAVMEAFAAAAKQKEESREEAEARIEHLNETSFDRRRKVAVYKQDGRRGHHMQVCCYIA